MNPLYGLVVCGGQSTRMGMDKSLLRYYELPQRYHLYHMLEAFCEKVYISCSPQQRPQVDEGYAAIEDIPELSGHGPCTALLSAQRAQPGASFLVLGCDYPLLTQDELRQLKDAGGERYRSASFVNEAGFPEPLIALYQAADMNTLSAVAASSGYSLRRFLEQVQAELIRCPEPLRLTSVDTPEQYRSVLQGLRSR